WLIIKISHTPFPLSQVGGSCKAFVSHNLQSKLTASGVDVVSFFAPDCRIHSIPAEQTQKHLLAHFRCALPVESFDSIVRNEVHFSMQTVANLGKIIRLMQVIIDFMYKNVFKSNSLAFSMPIVCTCVDQGCDIKSAINRHDFLSNFISRSVQGNRET